MVSSNKDELLCQWCITVSLSITKANYSSWNVIICSNTLTMTEKENVVIKTVVKSNLKTGKRLRFRKLDKGKFRIVYITLNHMENQWKYLLETRWNDVSHKQKIKEKWLNKIKLYNFIKMLGSQEKFANNKI